MSPFLADTHLVVTGAASGIGRAIAARAAADGARVSCIDVDGPGVYAVVARVSADGGSASAVQCDIRDARAVEAGLGRAVEAAGPIGALVACAGGMQGRRAPFVDLTADCWRDVLDLNLTAQFTLARAAALRMVAAGKGGSIVFVSSLAAHAGLMGHSHYAAAKAGLEAMARTMAIELAGHRLRVNCVAPGATRTAANRDFFDDPLKAGAVLDRVPLGRPAEPEEIVGAVLFLASERASYVTGSTLMVDGGFAAG